MSKKLKKLSEEFLVELLKQRSITDARIMCSTALLHQFIKNSDSNIISQVLKETENIIHDVVEENIEENNIPSDSAEEIRTMINKVLLDQRNQTFHIYAEG